MRAGCPSFMRRIGDGRAVIAARRRDHALLGALAHQQVGERAARLERPRMLENFELEGDRRAGEAKIVAGVRRIGVRRICGRMTSAVSEDIGAVGAAEFGHEHLGH